MSPAWLTLGDQSWATLTQPALLARPGTKVTQKHPLVQENGKSLEEGESSRVQEKEAG